MEKNTRPTQCARVIKYLTDYGTITSAEAFVELGIMDLPKRISELRQRGVKIADKIVKVENRYGETCHVKEYRFVVKENG
uniref:Helix-turn-helix domain protein n=1 Tax=Siphoviridae sp. ctnMR5 TaxID=2825658 RepID=A0A8S5U8S9_9CAUD|nr:MAG TPA: helix-turn-helix domain protein [Siphoviridae sp. ctnMR5]